VGQGRGDPKLEIDRRRIRGRSTRIKHGRPGLRTRRAAARAGRSGAGLPVVSLVGYTNAGKSTLLNTLTGSDVLAENRLFATLDPTTRRLRFPSEREVILTDTVGFIRELPKELMEAFRATLEELESADLLVQVADASHREVLHQIRAVEDILHDLGLDTIPRILVMNKWDRMEEAAGRELLSRFPGAIPVSALSREGLNPLVTEILRRAPFGGGVVARDVEGDGIWCDPPDAMQ